LRLRRLHMLGGVCHGGVLVAVPKCRVREHCSQKVDWVG
jgi:hypothetical protein